MASGGMKTTVAEFVRIQNQLNSYKSSYESTRKTFGHHFGELAIKQFRLHSRHSVSVLPTIR